jgi:threonyl-tRNA synthetase
MFLTSAEDRQMAVKPMNCPGHAHLFSLQQWSYRDLPIRTPSPASCTATSSPARCTGSCACGRFVQDDAHVFCTEEQIQDEVAGCLDFAFDTYRVFGLEPHLELSTRPENRLGSDELWDHAEGALRRALDERGLEYTVNEGDGAFYGPKIDLHVTDSLGRSWQLGTVQVDFNFPERFDLTYTGADNADHRVVMLHRALFGSFERFIGILLEDTGGELPLWLAPVQAVVLPIADRHDEPARRVVAQLRAGGVRAEIDDRTESVGRKIRDNELQKIPFMLVVGDREAADGTVSVREHGKGDTGTVTVDEFARRVAEDSSVLRR